MRKFLYILLFSLLAAIFVSCDSSKVSKDISNGANATISNSTPQLQTNKQELRNTPEAQKDNQSVRNTSEGQTGAQNSKNPENTNYVSETSGVKGNYVIKMNSNFPYFKKIKLSNINSVQHSQYNEIQFFEDNNGKENCVFDSQNEGIEFYGDKFENTEKIIKVEDNNKNGVPEIYFREKPFASDFAKLLIIEKNKAGLTPEYQVLFNESIQDYKFEDLDNNGTIDLYGYTLTGGQGVAMNYAKETAYKLVDGKYMPSYKLTKILMDKEKKEYEKLYNSNHQESAANNLIRCYLLTNDSEGFAKFESNNNEMLLKIFEPQGHTDSFIELFNSSLKSYNDWWERLKEKSVD